jgi:uncharacterized protein
MCRPPAIAIAVLLALIAAGCASPPSSFYTLSSANAPAAPPSTLSVAVGPVSVPGTVDRPEMVLAAGPNQVRIDEYNRWASPLKSEISRTVAENLVAMLGTDRVTQADLTASTGAQYRALIEVQRLESAPGKSAAFEAVWIVRRTGDGKSLSGRTRAQEPLREPGYGPVAAAHSRAVARLSQDIADAIRSLETMPR